MKFLPIVFFTIVLLLASFGFAQDAAYLNADAVQAPPEWLVNMLQSLHDLPIVGPFMAKAVQWLGVIVTIITSFVGFVWVSIRALSTVLNVAGLLAFADKLKAFEQGKIMYYLKYFSMFNAKKPDQVKVKNVG